MTFLLSVPLRCLKKLIPALPAKVKHKKYIITLPKTFAILSLAINQSFFLCTSVVSVSVVSKRYQISTPTAFRYLDRSCVASPLDILLTRKSEDPYVYFMGFSLKQRKKVRWVGMDMSIPLSSVVRRCFPRAKIIAGKFHVVSNAYIKTV